VGFKFSSLSSTVCLDDFGAILGKTLKGVHGNQNNATVCIDTMLSISVANGVEYCKDIEGENEMRVG
jgi:hypothetical protein